MFSTNLGVITGGNLLPTRSLDFEKDSTQYFTMSAANFGSFNTKKHGFSVWIKLETVTASTRIFFIPFGSAGTAFQLQVFNAFDFSFSWNYNGGSFNADLITDLGAGVLSTSNWYHLYALVDTTQATANDRIKLFVNGVQPTFQARSNPSVNGIIATPSNNITLGRYPVDAAGYFDGLMFQPAFFSGTLPAISDLYNAGNPRPVGDLPGLYSYLETTGSGDITDDHVLAANWTNNNGVTKSTEVP